MNTAAPWLFPELQGNNQSTPTSSHTFLLPYLYLSLPLNRYLLPFYLSHLFLLAHVSLVMLLRQSCTSFFSFNVRLLMNFPPVNCSGSLSFTCSKSTRKSRYRSLPFRSFEWNSPGVHKSGYKIKALAITLFFFLQCDCIPLPYFSLFSPPFLGPYRLINYLCMFQYSSPACFTCFPLLFLWKSLHSFKSVGWSDEPQFALWALNHKKGNTLHSHVLCFTQPSADTPSSKSVVWAKSG